MGRYLCKASVSTSQSCINTCRSEWNSFTKKKKQHFFKYEMQATQKSALEKQFSLEDAPSTFIYSFVYFFFLRQIDCLRDGKRLYLCEIGVPCVEHCGPEPGIERDLERTHHGLCKKLKLKRCSVPHTER